MTLTTTSTRETSIGPRVNGTAPPTVPLGDIDLGSDDFWGLDADIRDGAFATLRREAPISFHREHALPGIPVGKGHWALTRFDDVRHASHHPEIFSSSPSCVLADPVEEGEDIREMLLNIDDPRHLRLRSIVNRAFTPKVVARIEASIRERARRLVSAMVTNHPDGRCDLVTELAGPLPLQVICDMVGIPEEDHKRVFQWSNVIVGFGDPDIAADIEEYGKASSDFAAYGTALANERRADPRDDLTTSLVLAEVNGERLTDREIASFIFLLAAAGSETTRNAISHGLVALTRYPDERQTWWADFDGVARSAAEEILRWASPVMYMRRTLTEDTAISGTKMAAGDKVTMWYRSANRDDATFSDPWTFDVRRTPNPQVAFGGGGAHFCLGANLARREIMVAFDELRRQVPDIAAVTEPVPLQSSFVHGVKRVTAGWSSQ